MCFPTQTKVIEVSLKSVYMSLRMFLKVSLQMYLLVSLRMFLLMYLQTFLRRLFFDGRLFALFTDVRTIFLHVKNTDYT